MSLCDFFQRTSYNRCFLNLVPVIFYTILYEYYVKRFGGNVRIPDGTRQVTPCIKGTRIGRLPTYIICTYYLYTIFTIVCTGHVITPQSSHLLYGGGGPHRCRVATTTAETYRYASGISIN